MPGERYKDPSVETRSDVNRPFYFIRIPKPRITRDGKREIVRVRHFLGYCDEMKIRDAKKEKAKVMATVNQGKVILQSQITFGALTAKYKEAQLPTLGSTTQSKYLQHIDKHILTTFQDLRLCDIDTPMIQAWLNSKAEGRIVEGEEEAGLSWWTRADLRNILSAIWTKAKEWKLWEGDNPCVGVKLGRKRVKREKRIPKGEDLIRFLGALGDTRTCTAEQARLIVLTAVVCGLRVSEVLGLQPRDIDAEAKTFSVNRRWSRGDVDEPKNEPSRRTGQAGAFVDQLLAHCKGKPPDEYIFSRGGEPLDDRELQQHVFRPAAVAVGIYFEGFGMHTFRRLNVTWRQTVGGATAMEAQKGVGHASIDMTMLYTQTDQERERAHVDAILEKVMGKTPEGKAN